MLFLAAVSISDVISRFAGSVGIWHMVGMVILIPVTGYLLLGRRVDLSLTLMFLCSLLTAAGNEAVAGAAFVGRWYFLLISAVLALSCVDLFHKPAVVAVSFWALVNAVGMLYTPAVDSAIARAVFFALTVPGLVLVMTPPRHTVDDILRLLKRMAIIGVVLAGVHLIYVVIAPQGGGTARFKSAFSSGQVMSLATAAGTLPMIWALLSKNAGKWAPVFLVGTLINLLVMIASTQRTAMFSLAGAVVVILAYYRSRGVIIALLTGAGLAVIAWPIIVFLVDERFLMDRLSNFESAGRTRYWEWGIIEGLKHPFLGHGSGAGQAETSIRFGMKFHQAYISVFYDFGFVGLIAFLSMIGLAFWTSLRLSWRGHAPKTRAIGVFLLANVLMCVAQGFAETGLSDTANQTAIMFYLGIGLASSVTYMHEDGPLSLPQRAKLRPREAQPWHGSGAVRAGVRPETLRYK